jgi:hypothetical protein
VKKLLIAALVLAQVIAGTILGIAGAAINASEALVKKLLLMGTAALSMLGASSVHAVEIPATILNQDWCFYQQRDDEGRPKPKSDFEDLPADRWLQKHRVQTRRRDLEYTGRASILFDHKH